MPRLSLCRLVVTLVVIIKTATPSVLPQAAGSDPINPNSDPVSPNRFPNPPPDPDPVPQSPWYNPLGGTKLYSMDELTAMNDQVTSDIRAARRDSSQVEKLKKLQYAINQAMGSLKGPHYGAAEKAVAHETLRRLTKKLHWTRHIKTGGKIVGGALAGFGAFELAKQAKEKLEEEDDGDDKSWWQFWKKSKKNTKGKWPKGFKLGLPGTGGGGKNNGKGPIRLPKPKPASGMFSPMGIAFISLLGLAVLGLLGYWFLAFEEQEEDDERTRRTRRKKNRNSGSPSRKRQSRKRRRREDDDDSTK